MIPLAWVISVIFAAYIGYKFERLKTQVNNIKVTIQSKVDKKPVEVKPPSVFIDPDNPLMAAEYEFKETMRKLNPKDE